MSSSTDVDALRDLEARGVSPCLGERVPYDRHLLGELGRRGRPGAEKAIGVRDGASQRVRMVGAELDRRMQFLEGLGLHGGVFQLPEPSVELDAGLCPERLHQRQPLVEPSDEAGGIDPERGKHPASPSGADADLDPASRRDPAVERNRLGRVSEPFIDAAPQLHPDER